MRTFAHHEHKHELHGITVVVETKDGELWVGRCDDVVEEGVLLRDADVHRQGAGEKSREEWIDRARLYGVFPHYRQTTVRADAVVSVRRLSEL